MTSMLFLAVVVVIVLVSLGFLVAGIVYLSNRRKHRANLTTAHKNQTIRKD